MDFWRLVNPARFPEAALQAHHDQLLCVAAILLATMAAWVLLPITDRYHATENRGRYLWLLLGSTAMGMGVWAMHFTAMLAFRLPVPIAYDPLITIVSTLPAALASAACIRLTAPGKPGHFRLHLTALCLAAGIGTMHYTGMEAVIVPASMYYVPYLFILSIAAAYVLALVGLSTYQALCRTENRSRLGRLVGSVILGLAVSSMHFIAMRATYFQGGDAIAPGGANNLPTGLLLGVTTGTGIFLVLVILATVADKRFGELSESLQESNLKFRKLAENTPIAIFTFSAEKITYANPALAYMTGHSMERIRELPIHEVLGEAFVEFSNELLRADGSSQAALSHQFPIAHGDGTTRWLHMNLTRIELASKLTGLGSALDLTEQRKVQNHMEELAFSDQLTGLSNRSLFINRLQHYLDRRLHHEDKLSCVMMLDLDRFKHINDTYGHLAGDEVLREVATRMEAMLRPQDTLARLGGDEFVVLFEDLDSRKDEVIIAERLIEAVSKPFEFDDRLIEIRTSVGTVSLNSNYDTPDQVLNDADIALYRAKQQGRGRWVAYDAELDSAAKRARRLGGELKSAIQNGELELFYQPIVGNDGKEIRGFEALARWHRSDDTWIPPGEFIPIAEETGLITDIDLWTVREACHHLHQLSQEANWTEGYISMNGAAATFSDDRLCQLIETCIAEYELAPGRIRLELTERLLFDDSSAMLEKLRRLIAAGCELMIDDFGTGYSSLTYLHRFPISTVKIDRAFVASLDTDQSAEPVVRTIKALADSLNLGIIAEGVETEQQLAALRALGIEDVQGYLFGQPKPAAAVRRALKRAAFLEAASRSTILKLVRRAGAIS